MFKKCRAHGRNSQLGHRLHCIVFLHFIRHKITQGSTSVQKLHVIANLLAKKAKKSWQAAAKRSWQGIDKS